MGITRRQGRGKLYDEGFGLGYARNAESVVATGIVDPGVFKNAAAADGDYSGRYIYRAAFADDSVEQIRTSSVVDDDTLTQEQDPYLSLSDVYYELVGLLHPHELNDVFRRAQHQIFFETRIPLTMWVDGDFANSSVTTPHDWTSGASNCTPTKVTTGGTYANLGQTGFRNLVTTNSMANGYCPSSTLAVTPSGKIVHGFSARLNSGTTGQYILYDKTNSAAIRTVTFASKSFLHTVYVDTIPATCRQVELRLGGTGATDAVEWDHVHSHFTGAESRQLIVPSTLGERWRVLGFGPAEYGEAVATSQYNASARTYGAPWAEDADYMLTPQSEEANPFTLHVLRKSGLGRRDYWYHGLRPYSDINELDDESDETTAPEELFMSAAHYELFSTLHNKYKDGGGMSEWLQLRDEWKADLDMRTGRATHSKQETQGTSKESVQLTAVAGQRRAS